MSRKLANELIELSKKLDKSRKINCFSTVVKSIELTSENDVQLPYTFKCEALHPGIYKGYIIERDEIVKAVNTIFNIDPEGPFHNNEINNQHRSSRKNDSDINDLLGKVTGAEYDYEIDAYILYGEIYDKTVALKIANGVLKYVSLRINPGRIDNINGQLYASDLVFEELSFVRAPGDRRAMVSLN